jgi:hypothetical protein
MYACVWVCVRDKDVCVCVYRCMGVHIHTRSRKLCSWLGCVCEWLYVRMSTCTHIHKLPCCYMCGTRSFLISSMYMWIHPSVCLCNLSRNSKQILLFLSHAHTNITDAQIAAQKIRCKDNGVEHASPVPMRGDLPAWVNHRRSSLRVAFQSESAGIHCARHMSLCEQPMEPPEAGTRAVLCDACHIFVSITTVLLSWKDVFRRNVGLQEKGENFSADLV